MPKELWSAGKVGEELGVSPKTARRVMEEFDQSCGMHHLDTVKKILPSGTLAISPGWMDDLQRVLDARHMRRASNLPSQQEECDD